MASSLLALIDDIASVLDDIANMSKIAAKNTAGVLGDDLALNAQQVVGMRADRELPVVFAVAIGSLKNKTILVPAALGISTFLPWAITPLLMSGGAYLCYEGFEKLSHPFLHSFAEDHAQHNQQVAALDNPALDMVAFEKDKIRGAIRTDFILSAEVIVITLGTVADAPLSEQIAVLSFIALVITVGVYGLVAGIVKIDDAGLYLSQLGGQGFFARLRAKFGITLVCLAPYLMKVLSIVGTAAMFVVGGGILTHGAPGAQAFIHQLTEMLSAIPTIGELLGFVAPLLLDASAGVAAGAAVLALVLGVKALGRVFGMGK